MAYTILMIDDNEEMCLSMSEIFSNLGYKSMHTIDPCRVVSIIEENEIDLVISDVRMPGIGGIDLLKLIKKKDPSIDVIMITGFPTIENAIKAMKYGAANFYIKPPNLEELKNEVSQLCESRLKKKSESENIKDGIISSSTSMTKILNTAAKAAPTLAPILITGESGTGKEKIAEYIQQNSNRGNQPFIKINCAAIPDSLLESELFGHEKGAFTSAVEQKPGRFELADGGTIFLDEIGDMSMKTQAKILRIIQEQEFERVGGIETIKVNVRLIAATNKNLSNLIAGNEFREDLYYRLSVITIHLPPLRERDGDVPVLLEYFINYFNTVYEKNVISYSQEAEKLLLNHDWPGNIRELRNAMERAVIFCEGNEISAEDLPSQYLEVSNYTQETDMNEILDSFNREAIRKALDECGGIKQKAAAALDIDRRTLYNRMKKLGMR